MSYDRDMEQRQPQIDLSKTIRPRSTTHALATPKDAKVNL